MCELKRTEIFAVGDENLLSGCRRHNSRAAGHAFAVKADHAHPARMISFWRRAAMQAFGRPTEVTDH